MSGMTDTQILAELQALCRQVFGNPAAVLTLTTTAPDVDGWDSLSHVRLILAVERHFRIKLRVGEVMKLADVGALVALVGSKLAPSPYPLPQAG
jgi:acyl carrier protein